MSIKSKLLKEIEDKAQKIRDKRIAAASNKTIETAIFEFFKNIEESRQLHDGRQYDRDLFTKARLSLIERLRGFDSKVKMSIEFNRIDSNLWEDQQVRGVTVWWSQTHIVKNNVHPSLYIDIGQMLFF